jgi:hypothetical protein
MPVPPINHDYYPARWQSSRDGRAPLAIVAHGTGGTDSRAYLKRGGDLADGSDRKVSIQVLIQKDGTIYRMVADEQAAHHAGGIVLPDGTISSALTLAGQTYRGHRINQVTLGFELENLQNGKDPYTDAQLWSMGWQIARWRSRYGALPLVRHATLDPKRRRDPYGLTVATMELWATRAAAEAVRKTYRVTSPVGANIRNGRSTAARIIGLLKKGDTWSGYPTPGGSVTIPSYGTSKIWIVDEAGRGVWSLLLKEQP